MKKLIIVAIATLLFGCSGGLDTLKKLAQSQKEMKAEIDLEKQLFERLKQDLNNNRINPLTPKIKITETYGEPVFCRNAEGESSAEEVCAYRAPTERLESDILYLYFNKEQNLTSWKLQAAEKP